MTQARHAERGSALVIVMLLAVLLMALLAAYFTLSYMERVTTVSTMNGVRGFYSAEAGLNLRAEGIRARFLGFNRPSGASPVTDATACSGTNMGSGDFGCVNVDLDRRSVSTYVVESADNPLSITIPRGERYQNLSAQVYDYDVRSVAWSDDQKIEAILEMRFASRLVPLFQFAAFYNKDLEILPGPPMVLSGPVHTNADLYLDAGNSLDILGQVTAADALFMGRKNSNTCTTGDVAVIDPGTLSDLPACSATRSEINQSQLTGWNGMVTLGVDELTVPPPEALDPSPGELYWDKADVRIVLDLDGGGSSIEVRNPDGTLNGPRTAVLAGCPVANHDSDFFNHREGTAIEMLNIDLVELLDCAHSSPALLGGRALDDDTEGGLVVFLGVEGPNSNTINNYGVRVGNGSDLASTAIGAPQIEGLTFVTDQAVYLQGDYNVTNKRPAAFLADSLNILSNAWDDGVSGGDLTVRRASDTTINAAFLAGTDSTGGAEGPAAQDLGNYNGGLENYPRFHEDWDGLDLVYRGSFVSLNTPRHVDGSWGSQSYRPPDRDWDFDVDFRDAANLPPISPRFVYLRQEFFVREFEL